MGSHFEEEQFFESWEEMCSVSDGVLDCSRDCRPTVRFDNDGPVHYCSDVWINELESVHDRRSRFLKWLGLNSDQDSASQEDSGNVCLEKSQLGADRLIDDSGAVLRTSGSAYGSLSHQSSASSQSTEAREAYHEVLLETKLVFRNLDDGSEFVVDEHDQDGMLSTVYKVGSDFSLSFEEFQKTLGSSPVIQRLFSEYVEETNVTAEVEKTVKESWLKKFILAVRRSDRHGRAVLQPKDVNAASKTIVKGVKVTPSKKQTKELSSMYAGQEFLAHKGSISTIKFSLDGLYLASGGQDGIVRLWKIFEDDRPKQFDILASNLPHNGLGSSHRGSDKHDVNNMKKYNLSGITCTVFPSKVFKVQEKPLHEFQGHNAEILGLSWSKNRFLLSASADNTVRLWQVGCDKCLGVFFHTNYVTSIDFNPSDDNYFISGSIDGKVRIWEVSSCRVTGYTDIKEIVTAVCYRPHGKGGLVGSVTGNCFFYEIIENQLQLEGHICLQSKKKLPNNRITGFQFSPREPNKVVVTCADSSVRILSDTDVICKLKVSGLRIAANQIQASFTSDGKHIVSTSEDSNVYVWNYISQNSSQPKKIRSCESFMSQNALVAIPWCGVKAAREASLSSSSSGELSSSKAENGRTCQICSSDLEHKKDRFMQDWFSLTRGFLLESLTRGCATWPEEKLPDLLPLILSQTKCKSHYKLLKSACQSMLTSHMWGLVIVTAGWDGRIRTYLNYGLPIRL